MKTELDTKLNQLLESLSTANLKMSDALKKEYECLTKYNNEELSTIIDKKKELSLFIENQTRTMHKHLIKMGIKKGIYGLQNHLETRPKPDDNQTLKLWLSIEILLKKNKTLNEGNGAIVELNRKHTLRSLDVLRGQTGTQANETYGSDGYTQKEKITRNISIV